jgi:hypothetical protein
MVLLLILSAVRAATSLIYDDALTAGWSNWSWAQVDLRTIAPVHSGSHSLAVTYNVGW